jgi:bifunctional non-homologous end joining protein LigD
MGGSQSDLGKASPPQRRLFASSTNDLLLELYPKLSRCRPGCRALTPYPCLTAPFLTGGGDCLVPSPNSATTTSVSATLHFIRPCCPVTAMRVPKGNDWVHQPKLDGYRLQIVKDVGQVQLYSRSGSEWAKRLPGFADRFRDLPCRSAILDGVLVLPEADGAPEMAGTREAMEQDLTYFAFDLLHRDGHDLRRLSLIDRRRRLGRLLARSKIRCLHLVDCFDDGVKLLEAAELMQLEGIVSKLRLSPYHSGDCRDWRKIKTAAWREANRDAT